MRGAHIEEDPIEPGLSEPKQCIFWGKDANYLIYMYMYIHIYIYMVPPEAPDACLHLDNVNIFNVSLWRL